MAESKERIAGIAGEPRFTTEAGGTFTRVNAPSETDPDGVLKELDSHQIEQMDRQAVLSYQERRSAQIEAKRAEQIEADNFERFREAFVEAGGRERDAASAFEAQKKTAATEAAKHATTEILDATRRRVRHGL
jgi:hypothetical protein